METLEELQDEIKNNKGKLISEETEVRFPRRYYNGKTIHKQTNRHD